MARTRKEKKVRVSTREKLAIVEEAIRLIRKPEAWCKSKWRCEIVNDRGKRVFAYCLDGAIGYAAVKVLGIKRAIALGVPVYKEDDDYEHDGDFEIEDAGPVAALLSIRKMAYDALVEEGDADGYAEDDDNWHITYNDDKRRTHAEVIALLRKKARELRAKVKALDARKARSA